MANEQYETFNPDQKNHQNHNNELLMDAEEKVDIRK